MAPPPTLTAQAIPTLVVPCYRARMKRRTRTLVFLLAATALLGAAVVAELRHERALAYDPLTTIDIARVQRVDVACIGCTASRYEKVGGHWRQRAPLDAPADDEAVGKLLAIATAPVRFRRAAADLQKAKLGLDPPQATLTLDDATIAFGTTDAIRNDRYVAFGDSIALVPDRYSALVFAAAARPADAPKD